MHQATAGSGSNPNASTSRSSSSAGPILRVADRKAAPRQTAGSDLQGLEISLEDRRTAELVVAL
jgi:hypothetical protein